MTQDEIIEIAQECKLIGMRPYLDGIYSESLVAFANLVAAKEREALAQRTWVGLTDDEIAQGWKESWVTEQAFQSAVWWAEEKLKEKNT